MFGPKDTMLTLKNAPKSVSNKTCFWYGLWPPQNAPYRHPVEPILSSDGAILGLYCAYMLAPCWAHVTDPFSPPYEILAIFKNHGKNTIYDTILGLSWAFVQRIFTYVGSMLALYNAMSGPPGVHRTDHVRPMLDPKYALKSVSNKTCFWYGLWPPWKVPYDTLSSLS